MYAAARCVVVPAQSNGGSQRTVLEAAAMNVPIITMIDSEKTSEYLIDGGFGTIVEPEPDVVYQAVMEELKSVAEGRRLNSREYILNKWSEYSYADSLAKGLEQIVRQ
jgi:glycosyltransferase involved in cell wall biosynthesis